MAVKGESQILPRVQERTFHIPLEHQRVQGVAEGLESRARLGVSHGVAEPLGPAKAPATKQTISESVHP